MGRRTETDRMASVKRIAVVAAVVLLLSMAVVGAASAYSVTYDGNGATSGNVPAGSTEYAEGAMVTVLGNTGTPILAMTGYTFQGWNTSGDFTGTMYNPGETFSMPENDVTLHAVWMLEGYTRLDYLESSGTQYIDTGVMLTDKHEIEIRAKNLETAGSTSRYLFGCNNSNDYIIAISKNNDHYVADFADVSYRVISTVYGYDSCWHTFELKSNSFIIDGVQQGTFSSSTFSMNLSSYLFSSNGGYINTSWDISYCKIWDNDTLVRNYIPAYYANGTKNKKFGMYDTVNGVFYANDAGEADFQYKENKVTYKANGATSGTVPAEQTGAGITISGNTGSLIKNGNVFFSGWNTEEDGSGNTYMPGDIYSGMSDLTLYAQWTDEYTLVEYIESTGNQWIDTGISGMPEITMVCSGPMDTGGYEGLYGARYSVESDATARYNVFMYNDGTSPGIRFDFNEKDDVKDKVICTFYEKNIIKSTSDGHGYVNGQLIKTTAVSRTDQPYNIYVGTVNNGGTGIPYTPGFSGKIYGFKLEDSGTLVFNGVPCKPTDSDYGGLYDTVNGCFKGNISGTGNYTVGGSVYIVEYNGNGNTGGEVPVDAGNPYKENATVTVKDNTGLLVNGKYTFTGWKCTLDLYMVGGGKIPAGDTISADAEIKIIMPSQNVMFYADWGSKSTDITLDKNAASATAPSPSSVNKKFGSGVAISYTAATRPEFTLDGWYTAASGGSKILKADGSAVVGTAVNGWVDWNGKWVKTEPTAILYARWIGTYNITYKDQGGGDFTGTHDEGYPTKHTYGTATTLEGATKTGYTFGGWFTTSDCSGTAVTTLGATEYTDDITLYAAWRYTVQYNANGGTGEVPVDSTLYKSGATVTVKGNIHTMTKGGYWFAGWKINNEGDTYLGGTSNKSFEITGNTVLYAQWVQGYVDLEYIRGDGTQYIDTGISGMPEITMVCSGPMNTGGYYSLYGARSDVYDNTTTRYNVFMYNYGSTSFVRFDFDVTIGNEGTCTFNEKNIIKSTPDGHGYVNGQLIQTSAVSRTNQPYNIYVGTINNGGTGIPYSPGFSGKIYSFKLVDSGTLIFNGVPCKPTDSDYGGLYDTVNGCFKGNISGTGGFTGGYKVTYDKNEGTGTLPDAQEITIGNYATTADGSGLTGPEDKRFAGWNTQSDGKGTLYAPGQTIYNAGNMTLYAQWTENQVYTVGYNVNGASSGTAPMDTGVYSSGATVKVQDNSGSLTRTNYYFAGWNTKADGKGTTYLGPEGISSFPITENTVLYAKWVTSPVYKITYDGNESTGGTVPVSQYYVQGGTAATVSGNTGGLIKAGTQFSGWTDNTGGAGTVYGPGFTATIAPTKDTTLYAKWAVHVTYDANGATSGAVPEDTTVHAAGTSVTVLDNTGNLEKSGCYFAGWMCDQDLETTSGTITAGNLIPVGTVFTMPAGSVVLKAKWVHDNVSYTITIPPSLTLDEDITSSAEYVITLGGTGEDEDTRKVVLRLGDSMNYENGYRVKNVNGGEYLAYTVTENMDPVTVGDVIVSLDATSAAGSVAEQKLLYTLDEEVQVAGVYQDILTFTVGMEKLQTLQLTGGTWKDKNSRVIDTVDVQEGSKITVNGNTVTFVKDDYNDVVVTHSATQVLTIEIGTDENMRSVVSGTTTVLATDEKIHWGLPSGYTEVEYIARTTFEYIDTGFVLKSNSSLEIQYMTTSQPSNKGIPTVPIGGRISFCNNEISLMTKVNNDTQCVWTYGSESYNGNTQNLNSVYTWKMNKNVWTVTNKSTFAEESHTFESQTFDTPYSCYLFDYNNNGSTPKAAYGMRIYYCKIWDGDTLVRYFVPVKRDSDSVLGMYDLCGSICPSTGTPFYTNAGSGTFTAGPEVE